MLNNNENEMFDIQFYAFDNKLNVSILEEMILQKYNKLYWNVKNELFSKTTNQNSLKQENTNTESYEVYYRIVKIINNNINLQYNSLLENMEYDKYKDKKIDFIFNVKDETKKLINIKKDIKKIGNNSNIDPNYINNVLHTYNIDDEEKAYLIFKNTHNIINKIHYISLITDQEIDIREVINDVLSDYNISDELKNIIMSYYNNEVPINESKIIDLEMYKIKKLCN